MGAGSQCPTHYIKNVKPFMAHSAFDELTVTLFLEILKMKATLLCFFAILAIGVSLPEKYTDKYDTVNVQDIVVNRRLLIPYIKCVLGQGKCSPEGRELKTHIKDALETYCQKCTKAQQDGTRLVIGHLINHEPEYWNQLTAKYDPARRYVTRYEKELRIVKAEGGKH